MASTDSLYIEDRDAQNRDQMLDHLHEAGQRPDIPRGRDIGKSNIATSGKDQPNFASEKRKGSDYVLVTVEELDATSTKSDSCGDQDQSATKDNVDTSKPNQTDSEEKTLQIIPDGNPEVQAYSARMAQIATDQLKGANDSKALSDAAKGSLPERGRFTEAAMSVWSPDSEQGEADGYGFEVREKYYKEEL